MAHYAEEIGCSHKAASYDLWSLFSEIVDEGQRLEFLTAGAWWVGTVAQPLIARSRFQLTTTDLADYFKCRALRSDFPEHVMCVRDAKKKVPVSDAAIGINAQKLCLLMSTSDWYVPRFLAYEPERTPAVKTPNSDLPTGLRLSTTQRFNRGLMEIAANAATRSPDDPFCVVAAELSEKMPPNTLASKLIYLAGKALLADFPSRNTIKELI